MWLNWKDGISWDDPRLDHSGPLGWIWPDAVWEWHEGINPITWIDPKTGWQHRLSAPIGKTNFGSVPFPINLVPNMGRYRYRIQYNFHDDSYWTGMFNLSYDGGQTWQLVEVNQQECDERLKRMAMDDPDDPAGKCAGSAIYAGLRMGGWYSWRKYRKRRLAREKVSINPYGTDGVLKKT